MDTLNDTDWDVVIAGTGLQSSLLALALSRSDKKILHIDSHDYYGGAEAAFSLQEAESWAEALTTGTSTSVFSGAKIWTPEETVDAANKLSFPRAYSLALAPQLIYAQSKLLPALVSSKTYKQLEFLAMGSWFVYRPSSGDEGEAKQGSLLKVPTTREDLVFSDQSIDIRSKRAVMKVLRFLMEYEAQEEVWLAYTERPFADLLNERFKLPSNLHGLFSALTLSLEPPENVSTSFALPRIARHLRSTGMYGPGFSSVIPKWGGLSEIAQVGCRAGAVGGGVYVLGKGIGRSSTSVVAEPDNEQLSLDLDGGDTVKTKWLAGTHDQLQMDTEASSSRIHRSISIISSPLLPLFPPLGEGSPSPAGAVVVFPYGSLLPASLPVYLIIHSSETGECPQGQSVIYAATSADPSLLTTATTNLLNLINHETGEAPPPQVLWQMTYQQRGHPPFAPNTGLPVFTASRFVFPAPSLDLAFHDGVLAGVEAVWEVIVGSGSGSGDASSVGEGFLEFEDRNGDVDDDGADEP